MGGVLGPARWDPNVFRPKIKNFGLSTRSDPPGTKRSGGTHSSKSWNGSRQKIAYFAEFRRIRHKLGIQKHKYFTCEDAERIFLCLHKRGAGGFSIQNFGLKTCLHLFESCTAPNQYKNIKMLRILWNFVMKKTMVAFQSRLPVHYLALAPAPAFSVLGPRLFAVFLTWGKQIFWKKSSQKNFEKQNNWKKI